MNRSSVRGISAAMLAVWLLSAAAYAQDSAADDDLLPAVDTSAEDSIEPAVDSDAPEPAVSVAPAEDVTRSTQGARVMDRMELGRTEITGNQELPKVLYIVPWQKADPGDLTGRPVNSLLDEVLAPVDREEFIRQVNYYDDLQSDGND